MVDFTNKLVWTRTLFERAPQESRPLRDLRTFTPHNLPVLHAPAGRGVFSGLSMSVPGIQQSLYERLPIRKLLQQGPYLDPPQPGGRPWDPIYLKLTTNLNRNTKEAHEAAPILCQAIPLVLFNPNVPKLSLKLLTDGEEWPALLASAKTGHTIQELTKTAAPDTATSESVGISKSRTNCASGES